MKKLFLLLFLSLATSSFGQKGSIEGSVVFKLDSTALAGAFVYINETKSGTKADINGKFKLANLSPGEYELVFEIVGYGKDTLTNVVVNNDSVKKIILGLPPGPCYKNTNSKECPVDGKSKSVIPILYGFPDKKMIRKRDKGKIKLGGCEVTGCEPNWFCKIHQLEF
jgi:hypothetical protein